jgi:hypothetical protein
LTRSVTTHANWFILFELLTVHSPLLQMVCFCSIYARSCASALPTLYCTRRVGVITLGTVADLVTRANPMPQMLSSRRSRKTSECPTRRWHSQRMNDSNQTPCSVKRVRSLISFKNESYASPVATLSRAVHVKTSRVDQLPPVARHHRALPSSVWIDLDQTRKHQWGRLWSSLPRSVVALEFTTSTLYFLNAFHLVGIGDGPPFVNSS